MKKLFFIFSISSLGFLVSCGGGDTKNPETEARKDEAKKVEEASPASNPDYQKGLELVAKSDCFTCHKVSEAFTGPAYQAVADRYTPSDTLIERLANKVIQGGAGNWGQVPMIGHPQLSKEDATSMVKYIMALKK